jgi:hypothetical protein
MMQNTSTSDGLIVQLGNLNKLFLSNDILRQEIVNCLPMIQNRFKNDINGIIWKRRMDQRNMEIYEASSNAASRHHLMAHYDLKCHLNELLSIFQPLEEEESHVFLRCLYGKKLRKSNILHTFKDFSNGLHASVKTATFAAPLYKDAEFCFIDHTTRSHDKKCITRVMKSIPKEFHDHLTRHSILGNADYVIGGIQVESIGGDKCRIMFYGTCGLEGASGQKGFGKSTKSCSLAKGISFLSKMAKATRRLEKIIVRRRLGFQSFIYSTGCRAITNKQKGCQCCQKSFGMLRSGNYCQLCGYRICKHCIQEETVELCPGELRTTFVCTKCIDIVNDCLYDEDEPCALVHPIVFDPQNPKEIHHKSKKRATSLSYSRSLPNASIPSNGTSNYMSNDPNQNNDSNIRDLSVSDVIGQWKELLVSNDPSKRWMVLGALFPKDNTVTPATRARERVEQLMKKNLHRVRQYRVKDCDVAEADATRSYLLTFEEDLRIPHAPLVDDEEARIRNIAELGLISPTFVADQLNVVCELAAREMQCSAAFISVVHRDMQYAIANHQMPFSKLPRNETICSHALTTQKPFIVRNAASDYRFRQFFSIARNGFRFYASFPIPAPDGSIVASLCVFDKEPKHFVTNTEYSTMKFLADIATELVRDGGGLSLQFQFCH